MRRLGIFLLPPGQDASSSQGCPNIKFTGTHLYTWLERGTVRVKYLAQEQNVISSARLLSIYISGFPKPQCRRYFGTECLIKQAFNDAILDCNWMLDW